MTPPNDNSWDCFEDPSKASPCNPQSTLPFPGVAPEGDPRVQRDQRVDYQHGRAQLADVLGLVPFRFVPFAESSAGTNPYAMAEAVVATIEVPDGMVGVHLQINYAISTPELGEAIELEVWAGQKRIYGPWRGQLNEPIGLPLGSDRSPQGRDLTLRAIVHPDFWSTGPTPLRGQIAVDATLRVQSVTLEPVTMRGGSC